MNNPLIPVIVVISAVGLGFKYLFEEKESDKVSNEALKQSLRESRKNLKALTREKNRRKDSGNWEDEDEVEEV